MLKQIKAFDHIAGCSLGTKDDTFICIEILEYLEQFDDGLHGIFPEMAKHWKNLLVDVHSFHTNKVEDLDLDYYTNLLTEEIDFILPECTSLQWNDNELRVVPIIENAIDLYEKFNEVPFDQEHQIDINPNLENYIVVVNDRGNTTLYRWEADVKHPPEWVVVWETV